MSTETIDTQCCIVGGGPAGVMLGYLLARAGVEVVVLEKHADFFRDFRGDTIHPSTLELMHELGLVDDFLARPHQEVRQIGVSIGNRQLQVADFSHLPTHCKFLAFMPQWDFLNFLSDAARKYPTFHLRMQAEAIDLLTTGDRVTGVTARTPDGELHVRAELVVGCDGRGSIIRQRSGFLVDDVGAPMDVLWLRISQGPNDPEHTLGRIARGHIFILLDRSDYWQCGFVVRKGGHEEWQRLGLAAFRNEVRSTVPFFGDRVEELRTWDDVKLLTVRVDRLQKWHRPGLLCIGDASHAMSPIGGVGINLAIQDAVATANLLADPLYHGKLKDDDLAAVQRRREFPTRWTQRLQVLIQNRIVTPVLDTDPTATVPVPWQLKLMQKIPRLQRLPARTIGLGIRPEHIHTPERAKPA
jgi:2-polyprenyl-6-methoxyphenol hydroxylase-like FAD-dependent oxidoreductase